jgi:hypothetical protein
LNFKDSRNIQILSAVVADEKVKARIINHLTKSGKEGIINILECLGVFKRAVNKNKIFDQLLLAVIADEGVKKNLISTVIRLKGYDYYTKSVCVDTIYDVCRSLDYLNQAQLADIDQESNQLTFAETLALYCMQTDDQEFLECLVKDKYGQKYTPYAPAIVSFPRLEIVRALFAGSK